MSTLLAISGLVYTVVGGVLYFSNDDSNTKPPPISSIKPKPLIKKISHLPRFDGQSLDLEILYQKIKPLIFAASPDDQTVSSSLEDLKKQKIGTASILHVNAKSCLVVTDAKLLQNKKTLYLHNESGHAKADLVAKHARLDLALIHIDLSNQPKNFVQTIDDCNTMQPGDKVYSVGHSSSTMFKISDGTLKQGIGAGRVNTSLQLSDGYIGAPLYNSRGRLIGIVVGPNGNDILESTAILSSEFWEFEKGKQRNYDLFKSALQKSNRPDAIN